MLVPTWRLQSNQNLHEQELLPSRNVQVFLRRQLLVYALIKIAPSTFSRGRPGTPLRGFFRQREDAYDVVPSLPLKGELGASFMMASRS